jgi:hypothetical protein
MSTTTDTTNLPAAVLAQLERIWTGEPGTNGHSEADTLHELDYQRGLLADLAARRITARRIIGTGHKNPGKVAREYVEGRIAAAEADLASRGRTNSTNVSNAYGYARLAVTDPAVVKLREERDAAEAAKEALWVERTHGRGTVTSKERDDAVRETFASEEWKAADARNRAAARAWFAAADAAVNA